MCAVDTHLTSAGDNADILFRNCPQLADTNQINTQIDVFNIFLNNPPLKLDRQHSLTVVL